MALEKLRYILIVIDSKMKFVSFSQSSLNKKIDEVTEIVWQYLCNQSGSKRQVKQIVTNTMTKKFNEKFGAFM